MIGDEILTSEGQGVIVGWFFHQPIHTPVGYIVLLWSGTLVWMLV